MAVKGYRPVDGRRFVSRRQATRVLAQPSEVVVEPGRGSLLLEKVYRLDFSWPE